MHSATSSEMTGASTPQDSVNDEIVNTGEISGKEDMDESAVEPVEPVDEAEVEPETKPEVEPGTASTSQELYRREKYQYWEAWEGALPEDDIEKYKEHALVVRRERDPEGGGVLLHSINVQSPWIRKFLAKVFEGHRVYTDLKRLTFRPPFHDFYYCWDKFKAELAAIEDEKTREHVLLLEAVIAQEMKPHLEAHEDLIKLGVVTFEYLWALFPPDTEVYAQTESGERLYLARRCVYQKNIYGRSFVIECEYIDYNGSLLGFGTEKLVIDAYRGHQQISEINPLPVAFMPDIDKIRQRLSERGRTFEKLIGIHYKGYSGLYSPAILNAFLKPRRLHLDKGRIVIDAKLFHEQDPDRKPRLRPLDSDIKEKERTDDDHDYYEPVYEEEYHSPDERVRQGRSTLKEEEYRYCSPLVAGYCLTTKKWATFEASQVTGIEWSRNAFEKLVLPYDYKELILSIAESQLSRKDGFDDIISGKGQGIIMLLSGEPGVGKTLTAEAVSEEMRCPLYAMSAGELGSEAYEVEQNLQKVLEISAKWDAVLLLDECDVFLEERSTTDIHRNKLVSVFLRLLEYYKGVMFLTSNRSSSFDPAFQSRIHLTIDYPSLDHASRQSIWNTFARPVVNDRSCQSLLTDEDIAALADMTLNGREIKNIVKTARLLSSRKNVGLDLNHIKTVLRINPRYISKTEI